jgi:hypothetical protein
MKLNHVIAIILFSLVSSACHASQWVSIGKYSLVGTLQDGARDTPGLIVETTEGKTYRGLALDDPLNITHITVGVDTTAWPVLERGRLDHIQMVMDRNNAVAYKELYGKHVIVECFIDFVGRYYTPVFCGVNKITLAPESATSNEPAIRTASHSKKHSVTSAKTKSLFDTLSYCVVPTAQYGQYSSYDGGKSPGNILMEKCNNEFIAWKKSCLADGGTEDSCIAEGFVYVQSALKKFNK